ncbi:histone-fold-containing protein [Geopyxis carbonaria]|nr:histone-fold-containing protein [Geopyxis carbonaria]
MSSSTQKNLGGLGHRFRGEQAPGSYPSTGGKGRISSGQGIGKGLVKTKRHRKVVRDNIKAVSKGDIRRLARRGGVKRISASIYDEMRAQMKSYLTGILKDCVIYVEHGKRKTVTVTDVIFALRRIGRPVYGFDTEVSRRAKK